MPRLVQIETCFFWDNSLYSYVITYSLEIFIIFSNVCVFANVFLDIIQIYVKFCIIDILVLYVNNKYLYLKTMYAGEMAI